MRYKTLQQFTFYLLFCSLPFAAYAAEKSTYNRISFSEQADVEVENDTLVAVMYVQKEGKRTDHLAEKVNNIVSQALQKVQNLSDIKVQTLTYRTNPVYHKQTIKTWRVHQAIQLESKNSKLLGQKIGELQSQLNVQSISYKVSKEKQREYADELINTALKRFEKRAQSITKTLGKRGYKIVQANINTGNTAPHRSVMHDSMRMEKAYSLSSSAPVALEAGTQRLTVTINGEIELLDR